MASLETAEWGLAYRADTADEWILKETSYGHALRAIRPGWRVLDVGAHIGSFAARAGNRGAHVWAFEPSPATFEVLTVNARRFNFHAYQQALTAGPDHQWLTFYDAPTTRQSPYASLKPKRGYNPIRVQARSIRVMQRAIKPMLIKLDVEGVELELLEALDLLAVDLRVLVVEYDLYRDRAACDRWDEDLEKFGLHRVAGRPVSELGPKTRSIVRTYHREPE